MLAIVTPVALKLRTRQVESSLDMSHKGEMSMSKADAKRSTDSRDAKATQNKTASSGDTEEAARKAKEIESGDTDQELAQVGPDEKPLCGIVMPISEIDGCPAEHWQDVYAILIDALDYAGFKARLVSNADEVGVIHRRIVQNLYDDPIVVCDVSGKNPNVMFELGMRLAFDKPTIIVKDDRTSYSFDTSPVEHLEYPRDLRFSKIVDFKIQLGRKVKSTLRAAEDGSSYTTFLQHFGNFKVADVEPEEPGDRPNILKEIESLRDDLLANQTMLRSLTSVRRDLGTTKRYRELPSALGEKLATRRVYRDGRPATYQQLGSRFHLWRIILEAEAYHLTKLQELVQEGVIAEMAPAQELSEGKYSVDVRVIAEATSSEDLVGYLLAYLPESGVSVTAVEKVDH